jgi:hypothetical protein
VADLASGFSALRARTEACLSSGCECRSQLAGGANKWTKVGLSGAACYLQLPCLGRLFHRFYTSWPDLFLSAPCWVLGCCFDAPWVAVGLRFAAKSRLQQI